MLDCLIVGSGPSGVTASLYLKRASINIRVVSLNESPLKNAKIENYYGFLDVSGKTLYENGLKQLENNNIPFTIDEVISIEPKENYLSVKTSCEVIDTKYLILGIGKSSNIDKRFKDYLGLGVSLCAHCDAPLFKNRKINVTGKEPYLSNIINELKLYSNDINIIDYDSIKSCFGSFNLDGIVLNNDEKIELDNLFIGTELNQERLLFELGLNVGANGVIVTDNENRSSNNRIYVVGDFKGDLKQVHKATYDGMISALSIIKEIKNA